MLTTLLLILLIVVAILILLSNIKVPDWLARTIIIVAVIVAIVECSQSVGLERLVRPAIGAVIPLWVLAAVTPGSSTLHVRHGFNASARTPRAGKARRNCRALERGRFNAFPHSQGVALDGGHRV